jgi:hypothetical protein
MRHPSSATPDYLEPADVARARGLTTAGIKRIPETVLPVAARTPRGGRLYDPQVVNKLAEQRRSLYSNAG